MGTVDEINGVALSSIGEINGVAKSSIDDFNGQDCGSEVSSRWVVGSSSGKIFSTSTANASAGWVLLVDLGSNAYKDIAIGKDAGANKRWVLHASNNTNELAYINDSADMTTAGNWSEVNFDPNHKSVGTGGPAVAWGNNVWVLGGTTQARDDGGTTYYDGPHRSTNGAAAWTKIDVNNTINDSIKVMCWKGSGDIWLMGIQSHIWKSTDNGASWSDLGAIEGTKDIRCLAYDGNSRWVAGLDSDNVYYSDDDGSNWTEVTNGAWAGTWAPNGIVYAKGSINKWVMCGANGRLAHSSDGVSWTSIWEGDDGTWSTTHCNSIATDHHSLVLVGDSGKLAQSTNGTSFTVRAIDGDPTESLHCVSSNVIGAGMY